MEKKQVIITGLIILLQAQWSYAGPPFNTDDPQPVDFKHWEFYLSSLNTMQPGAWTGTSPHVELIYGLIPNVQVHLLLPVNYNYARNEGTDFGYAYTEFDIKYRFVQESDNRPQIGVFPIIEIPTIKNNEFGNGKAQIYIPVWVQKTWDRITTYGGVGYWINPGPNHKTGCFQDGKFSMTSHHGKFHLLFSLGHSMANESFMSSYVGLLWTI